MSIFKRDRFGRFAPLRRGVRSARVGAPRRIARSDGESPKKIEKRISKKWVEKKLPKKFPKKAVEKRLSKRIIEKKRSRRVEEKKRPRRAEEKKRSRRAEEKKRPRRVEEKKRKKRPRRAEEKKRSRLVEEKKRPKKVPKRRPSKKPRREVERKLPKRKRKKKAELPPVPVRSREAETVIQAKLATLLGLIDMTEGGLDMAIQTFINGDGSVDGELRINRLPDRWRMPRGLPELIAALSSAFQTFPVFEKAPSFGGGFWATFGVRFGPQNETEVGEMADLYKRFRGLFQIGTYPTPAWNSGPIQMTITDDKVGLRSMIRSLEAKRGIPPSSILIRFLWGPEWAYNSRLRPGHYKDEK